MGYFSNGEEGRRYEAKYCHNCVNWRHDPDTDTDGCPVWDMHFWHVYDAYGKKGDETLRGILESFIPRSKEGPWNEECKMFKKSRRKR